MTRAERMIPETMAGVQLVGHGGPDMLVWNDAIPVPRPGPGQVLVRVRAAGINNTDINTRIGWYAREVTGATDAAIEGDIDAGGWSGALTFPRIQGADLVGEIVALGAEVETLTIGMRVTAQGVQDWSSPEHPNATRTLGSEMDGAFADYCLLEACQVFDVTASPLSDLDIAAMPCAFGTAWGMIERAGVGADDTVFVTGASGGVGLAAVMLARHQGARVIAATSPEKVDQVRDAGASVVLDRAERPKAERVTVWVDLVGGARWGDTLDALCTGGRVAIAGAIAGPMAQVDLRTVYLKDLTIFGCTHQPRDGFARLIGLINSGAIRPLVSNSYPLRDIARAQEDFSSKRYPGKLVLIP